jgi:hypothetical protein
MSRDNPSRGMRHLPGIDLHDYDWSKLPEEKQAGTSPEKRRKL